MPCEVIIQEKQAHIRVEVSGDRTQCKEVEDAISVWSQVAQICSEKRSLSDFDNLYTYRALTHLSSI